MSYSHAWGQGGSESKNITVGSSSGVSVELEPGESIEAQLTASRGVMKVRITYRAQLSGSTAINYNPPFKGHHFWGLDIGGVMQSGGLSNSIQFTEDIEVGYFSNAKIELRDPQGKLKSALLASPGIRTGIGITAAAWARNSLRFIVRLCRRSARGLCRRRCAGFVHRRSLSGRSARKTFSSD